jgi:hypothetical protein
LHYWTQIFQQQLRTDILLILSSHFHNVSHAFWEGNAGYVIFLKDIDKLPAFETLIIHLRKNNHALSAVILHLQRRCSSIRKLKLFSDRRTLWEVTSKFLTFA